MAAIALGIYSSPHSYAYLHITGQCDGNPSPPECKWLNTVTLLSHPQRLR